MRAITWTLVNSLRFGPHPPDLTLADPSGREYRTSRTHPDFACVRFRQDGCWTLGVLRGWRQSATGTIVRIESFDPRTNEARALWYRFVPEAIDPVQIDERSGQLWFVPPEARGAAGREAGSSGAAGAAQERRAR